MRGITFLLITMLCGCSSTTTEPATVRLEDATDVFYVEGATLSDPRHQEFISDENAISAYLDEVKKMPYPMFADFVWAGHRIGAGRGNIIAFREIVNLMASSDDDMAFIKMTIWLPELPREKGSTIELDVKEIIGFRSFGLSTIPGQHGCLGYGDEGSVSVTRLNDTTLSIELNLQFDWTSDRPGSDACKRLELKEVIIAKEKALADLTPWDGREGSHVYDETYR